MNKKNFIKILQQPDNLSEKELSFLNKNIFSPIDQFDSKTLLELSEMQNVTDESILIVRGVGGKELLKNELEKKQANIAYLECYQRIFKLIDFNVINSPKIIASASEGGTNLFPMMYFDTPAFLSQSPQLYKQLAVLGGLERVFEIGPAFRAEKHDTYRHLNEFISFDIEGAWMNDEDVMGVQERMIHHIWSQVVANDLHLIDVVNEYKVSQGQDPVTVEVPELPFPRIPYCDAMESVQKGGGDIEWGDDIESHHCDIIAAEYPGFHFLPRWPMSMKPFYIYHDEDEKGSTGGQLSRGFDLNYGRDEMTSGGQREHRVDVLEQNLRNMDLDPADFTFYTDGFRYGAPPHAGWGLGVARLLMILTGAGNVREVVLFPRDRSRVTP